MIDESQNMCLLQVKLIFDVVSKWRSSYNVSNEFINCKTNIEIIKYIFKIIERDVSTRVKNELALLVRRLGGSTFSCLANVTTLFMSFEFESLLKRIVFDKDDGRND